MSRRPFYNEESNLYWILKGRVEQGVPEHPKVGQTFTLEKAALFNDPVDQVLLVCNDDFEAVAYAKVLSFEQGFEVVAHPEISPLEQKKDLTRVHCQIVKPLSTKEPTSLTQHLQTTQQLMKGNG